MNKGIKPSDGGVYADAVVSQLGIGCVEFKVARRDGEDMQEINIYSQLHGKSNNGWGVKLFTGTLPELIDYFTKANSALSVLSQIGDIIRPR